MNFRNLIYFFISLLFLIPSTSFALVANGGLFPIAETDSINFQLFSFYDLRDRESFVQVTNTGSAATVHVQVFDVSNLCNENNFNDTYTANDSHVYNMRDIQTNDASPSGVEMPDNAYGFVVVTVVPGNGQPTDTNGLIIGNFRVIDSAGYEYRSNSQGFQPHGINGSKYVANFNSAGGINKSDIVGITVNNLLSGAVTAGSSVTFDTFIFNNNEVEFSCSDTTFSCTENTFEYGINGAIPHSRDKALACPSNNISEGFVKFIVLNTGTNSRGSMDSLVAVRTPSCGDSFLDTSIGETCDPPGVLQPPNDDECRDDCTFCGDGIMDPGEDCDDGNDVDDDDCPNNCTIPIPVGACCMEAFMCAEVTEVECPNLNGVYQGDDTICLTDCQQPPA
jgi:hypothetical protein